MLSSPPQTLNTSYLHLGVLSRSGTPVVIKLGLHIEGHVLHSHQMAPTSFHAKRMFLQFKTWILEWLLPNAKPPTISPILAGFSASMLLVSPPMAGLWLLLLGALSMFGTSLAQTLSWLKPLLGIMAVSIPSPFLSPTSLSQHPIVDWSNSGRLVACQPTQLQVIQCPHHPP